MEYDRKTALWFNQQRLGTQTTVCQCDKCKLFYKPSLGHKCSAAKERAAG